jgi:hypothetical protein
VCFSAGQKSGGKYQRASAIFFDPKSEVELTKNGCDPWLCASLLKHVDYVEIYVEKPNQNSISKFVGLHKYRISNIANERCSDYNSLSRTRKELYELFGGLSSGDCIFYEVSEKITSPLVLSGYYERDEFGPLRISNENLEISSRDGKHVPVSHRNIVMFWDEHLRHHNYEVRCRSNKTTSEFVVGVLGQ